MHQSLGGEGFIIGSVGRLDEQKGYACLIRAAKTVCGVRPDVSFVIAGEGPQREYLQGLIDSLGLSERFRLLGFRKDTEVVTSALNLYVSSSLWEGSPLTVLDALALGVPVVSTRVGVVPEVLVNRENGWLTRCGDVDNLARGILEATNASGEARAKIVAMAKLAVASFQDVKGLARQFETVLSKVSQAPACNPMIERNIV